MRPVIMSYQNWMSQTDVLRWHGKSNKARGDDLKTVDLLLDTYHKNPAPDVLLNLQGALEKWVRSKTTSTGALKTMRDHNAINTLLSQVQRARTFSEPVAWSDDFPNIYIAHDMFNGNFWVPDDFVSTTKADLNKIITKPKGEALLRAISGSNKKVVIQYTGGSGGNQAAPVNETITPDFRRRLEEQGGVSMTTLLMNPNIVARGVEVHEGKKRFIPNVGAAAIVKFKHHAKGFEGDGDPDRPSFIGLAHELVHVYHFVRGVCARSLSGGTTGNHGSAEEEMYTIGVLGYADVEPSENAIRGEWNMALRKSYSGYKFADTECTLTK